MCVEASYLREQDDEFINMHHIMFRKLQCVINLRRYYKLLILILCKTET